MRVELIGEAYQLLSDVPRKARPVNDGYFYDDAGDCDSLPAP